MIKLLEEQGLSIYELDNKVTVPYDRLDEIKKELNRIQRKAMNYGGDVSFEFGSPYDKTVRVKGIDGNYSNYTVKAVDINVSRGIVSKGNYTVLAYVEFGEGGNVVVPISDVPVKPKWYTVDGHCDHCNTIRKRNAVFIVKNDDTGEEQQIGKTCLQDYTGISPLGLVYRFYLPSEIYSDMNENDFYDSLGGGKTNYLDTTVILGWAIHSIKKFGYIKKEYADSTYSTVLSFVDRSPNEFPEEYKEEVDSIISFMTAYSDDNSYMLNCKHLVIAGYCKLNYVGLLCYLPLAVKRELERRQSKLAATQQRNQEAKLSEYMGQIGEKITVDLKSSMFISSFETEYGYTYIYKFIDINDNVLIWFKSSPISEQLESLTRLIGTVKSHSERDGVKQTIVTRCKIN